ncbi:DUF814 domain-containing protein [Candidatus Micrarchaeota archaeon]|nr:DUF814 domain-containing protein [Candidatus Micrarchaeota archaeon]
MRIILDITKSLNENASHYYQEAKKLKEKVAGARKAIEETKKQLKEVEKEAEVEKEEKKIRIKRQKEWYEKYHWFFSSDNFLIIAGKDAKQNEQVVAHHLEERDLFMHADIHGAPATIIKNGTVATKQTLEEAAQFAASFSNAWKQGYSSVDVYAVKKDQVLKYSQGEHVAKGGFVISGEKQWFKAVELGLTIGLTETNVQVVPERTIAKNFLKSFKLKPGDVEKGTLAKNLTKQFNWDVDEILQVLPTGKSRIIV